MCLEAIIAIHQPPEQYRVSPSRYPVATEFHGTTRAGFCYVIAGCCSFTFGEMTWELQKEDIATLPPGEYRFRVIGGETVELVSVWELPPEFWSGK
jgi:mannose-6-phosphate isomerase-like protein (cupin superfamily)